MSESTPTHDALVELDRVVRDFRPREGVESDFAFEAASPRPIRPGSPGKICRRRWAWPAR